MLTRAALLSSVVLKLGRETSSCGKGNNHEVVVGRETNNLLNTSISTAGCKVTQIRWLGWSQVHTIDGV